VRVIIDRAVPLRAGGEGSECVAGNPYFIGLGKGCPSFARNQQQSAGIRPRLLQLRAFPASKRRGPCAGAA
jgi:hypothetical protein